MYKLLTILAISICLASSAQAQQDTTSLKSPSIGFTSHFKFGAGVLFLRNSTINDLHRTNAFLMPSVGLEIVGLNLGFYLDVGSTFTVNSAIDTTVYKIKTTGLNPSGNKDTQFRQTLFSLGMLHRNQVAPNIWLRGKLGASWTSTKEEYFQIENESLGLDTSLGFEMHTTRFIAYYVDLHYQHIRSKDLGLLGGFKIVLGIKFVDGSSSKLKN